ncbi:DUF4395 domain-containing protein [Agrococcus sp. SGAir0287]|uniref:DUF4395 domain-containing protein n=1 Tax=Agrococcus sp. SGAir0287 TaxID=2070347 RepID=UPI0010CD2E27|nr:DUF4395 domain-containing protein [Agrococcus sp. SGAir0287]QCR19525.1 DUF4395 domain-containing protein [Agrococcus sp. SGAir0287]
MRPGFPDVVNELAARVVAALVVVATLAIVALGATVLAAAGWALWAVAAGFALRVGWGPRLSPFGLLATRVVAPRLGAPRLVPGAPKRFAQAIGLAVSAAAALAVALGSPLVAWALAGVLVLAASAEAVVGFCLGCWLFAWLMRVGVIPASVCEACADVTARLRERSATLAAEPAASGLA